ncbi:MAG: NADH-quinone oxidoreductase subunit L [Candidatus Stahlbacteria bacterium]|nr:NADH-quinone oxidoreductase subunit L [Candidatus Stahlbacteria bacterium]
MFKFACVIPFLPFCAFAITGLFTGKHRRVSQNISIFAIFFSLCLSVLILMEMLVVPGNYEFQLPWLKILPSLPIEIGMLINPLSSVMLVVVCTVSFFVQVYSAGYMHGDSGYCRYYTFLSLFSFSMLGLVVSNNLLQMYIFWELVGICSYLLIGHWYFKPEAANASKKAFIVTRFGDFGFLIAILIISYKVQTFNFLELQHILETGAIPHSMITVIAILLFCGAMGKSAQFPLHIWLPDAMEGPTPVSALIHAATMVAAGVYLVARTYFIFSISGTALTLVAIIGCFTAFFAGSIALVQDDIKRVLAYSTVSQLGYMMLGLGVGAYTAGFFHLTTHASFKALLFLCAGSIIHSVKTNNIWEMGGLYKNMKITAITFLIGGLALAGIFPFSGFWSKDEIILGAYNSGHYILFGIALLTAAFTAFYMARVFFVVFFGKKKSVHTQRGIKAPSTYHESPSVMTIPLIILAFLAAILGIFTHKFGQFIHYGPHLIEGEHNEFIPVISNIVAIVSIFFAWVIYQKEAISSAGMARQFSIPYKILKNKYYVDEFYSFCVRNILFVISGAAGWFDRNVVDGAVNVVGSGIKAFGSLLRKTQTGLVQNYAIGLFGGIVLIWFIVKIIVK